MKNLAVEAEEGFLEEGTLRLSPRKRNRIPRGREDKERHFMQRKQHRQRYEVMETHGI